MNERVFLLICILICSCGNPLCAQQNKATDPLEVVLEALEERFEVQFNYASALVEGILIEAPEVSLDLKTSIDQLSEQSGLKFVFISDNLVSIHKKDLVLCGYVKDKDTQEPLPYVTIQHGSKGTIADDNGYFEFEVGGGNDNLEIRHVGFKPLSREIELINTSNCATFYLVPEMQKLAEVVLYDYLIRGVDKLDDGSLQIDFEKFTVLPGLIDKDALHAVQALPGIQSIDESVSNINIRGGSNDQNLITWDGIKMYQSGHFFGLISMYNPHITQKVSLLKNGSPAALTDGVSGTIAMETNSFLNQGTKGSIGANLIDGNGHIDTRLGKKASVQVAARKSIGDLVRTPTYAQYFDRIKQDTELEQNEAAVRNSDIAFDFYDASIRLLYHPSDKDKLRLNFILTTNEVLFDETSTVSGEERARQSRLEQGTLGAGLEYQRQWSENWKSEISIYETDYLLKAVNANVLENQRFLQENGVSETGITLKLENAVRPWLGWQYGYQLTETKVSNLDDVDDPRFILLNAEVLRSHGLFTEIRLSSPEKKTVLNLGLRYNYLDKFKKHLWEPRVSLRHKFNRSFAMELLGEFKHQSTSQVINFQNDFLGVEKRRWQLSDDNAIPVITSGQASLGASYSRKGWLANLAAFYKRVDGITTQSQGFQDRYEFVRSSGAYDAVGADFLLRKQISKSTTWLSYSYLDSQYRFRNLPEPSFRNNYDISHALSLGANHTMNRFLMAAGLNWRTGKPFTRPVSGNEVTNNEINYEDVNSAQQSDYLRIDLSGKYRMQWGETTRAELGLAIWNLFNRKNNLSTFYRTENDNNVTEFRENALGFTPNLSFRIYFD